MSKRGFWKWDFLTYGDFHPRNTRKYWDFHLGDREF